MHDFIVVGAGILGASTAYHLTKEGADVLVVDRKDKGQATDAAAGIVNPWLSQRRNKAWYLLAKEGAKYYPSLIKDLKERGEQETGYSKVGAINLHTEESKLNKMEERALHRIVEAPEMGEIKRLSPRETKERFPVLGEGFSSLFVSGAARVDGRALRDALLNASINGGASILTGNATLVHSNQQVTGVQVNGEMYQGKKVIVTAGAWANVILAPLGIKFLVSGQKAQIVHLRLEDTETENLPVVSPQNNQYIVAFEKGKVIVGATHEDEREFDTRVTAGGMQEILEKALQVAPGLTQSTFLETRVGFRPFTPGFLPVVGPVPNWDGLIIANGLGASGLTVGPYLGAQLAKLAVGRETDINIEDYNVSGALMKD
ncbi:MAG: FAD-binding oxidoreductase [Bacillus sp. (in: Bacteria)]|nr:FAD-binding oxidoreductase [Bacillus sp. (in: firmicutes)]